MAYPKTLSEFSRGRRAAIVATLGGRWIIGPFSIDLYLPALPILGGDLGVSQQRGRARACELRPGTCADMTIC